MKRLRLNRHPRRKRSSYYNAMSSLAMGRVPRLKRGILMRMTIFRRTSILDGASKIMFGKSYGNLGDYTKERVWDALEGELK